MTHLERQHSQEVLRPVGKPTFSFRAKLSEGTVDKRREHGAAPEVYLAENARGTFANEQSTETCGIACDARSTRRHTIVAVRPGDELRENDAVVCDTTV